MWGGPDHSPRGRLFDVCAIVPAMSRTARPSKSAATDRAIADLVREGVVERVDLDKGLAVVVIGDITTPPIPWLAPAGDLKIWAPPTVGEQVTVLSPEADLERAVITGSLPSTAFAPLFLGKTFGFEICGEAVFTYDPEAKALKVELPGTAELIAPEGLTIKANVAIEGDVSIEGGLVATKVVEGKEDVVGAGKSLKGHTHSGVSSGTSFSGPPR